MIKPPTLSGADLAQRLTAKLGDILAKTFDNFSGSFPATYADTVRVIAEDYLALKAQTVAVAAGGGFIAKATTTPANKAGEFVEALKRVGMLDGTAQRALRKFEEAVRAEIALNCPGPER